MPQTRTGLCRHTQMHTQTDAWRLHIFNAFTYDMPLIISMPRIVCHCLQCTLIYCLCLELIPAFAAHVTTSGFPSEWGSNDCRLAAENSIHFSGGDIYGQIARHRMCPTERSPSNEEGMALSPRLLRDGCYAGPWACSPVTMALQRHCLMLGSM